MWAVSLDDWSKSEETDAGRARRLAGSYVAAMAVVAAVLAVGVVFGGQIKNQVFDEEVEVKFVPPEPVKPAPPPPAPPPPPPPPPKMASHAPPPKGATPDAPPTELPKGPPEEGDPNKPKEEGLFGDPNGVAGGTGRGGAGPAPKAPEAPPPPPPPPAPPVQVAEVSTPPIPVSKPMPSYPEDARKQGIEALVVVKFVVGEDGLVDDPRVVKGHPLFDDAVLASVRRWTFQPATLEGKAVRMVRLVKIPFRLKHS